MSWVSIDSEYIELPWWLSSKEFTCNAGDPGLIPGSGRSPWRRRWQPTPYSCLENYMDTGAWWATVHGVSGVGHGLVRHNTITTAAATLRHPLTRAVWEPNQTGFCPRLGSVQVSHSVMSNPLRPHGLQHSRPPWPSPTPRVYTNSGPLSWWCHPTISSSVIPFSCPQSFPASGSFPMSQLFPLGGQSIVVSASTSVLPVNTQDWSPLGWTGWISLQSKGLSRVFSNTTVQKHQFFSTQLSL